MSDGYKINQPKKAITVILCIALFSMLKACKPSDYDLLIEANYQKRPIKALQLAEKVLKDPFLEDQGKTFLNQNQELIEKAIEKCQEQASQVSTPRCVQNWIEVRDALQTFKKKEITFSKNSYYSLRIRRGYKKTLDAFCNYQRKYIQKAWDEKRYRAVVQHGTWLRMYEGEENKKLNHIIKEAGQRAKRYLYVHNMHEVKGQKENTYYQAHPFGKWLREAMLQNFTKKASSFIDIQKIKRWGKWINKQVPAKETANYIIDGVFWVQKDREQLDRYDNKQSLLHVKMDNTDTWVENYFSYDIYEKTITYDIAITANIRTREDGVIIEKIGIAKRYQSTTQWRTNPDPPHKNKATIKYPSTYLNIPDQEFSIKEEKLLRLYAQEISEELVDKIRKKIDKDLDFIGRGR